MRRGFMIACGLGALALTGCSGGTSRDLSEQHDRARSVCAAATPRGQILSAYGGIDLALIRDVYAQYAHGPLREWMDQPADMYVAQCTYTVGARTVSDWFVAEDGTHVDAPHITYPGSKGGPSAPGAS